MTSGPGWARYGFAFAVGLFAAVPAIETARYAWPSKPSPVLVQTRRRYGGLDSVFTNRRGREVVVVVLGSARCGASQGSDLARQILAVRDSARSIATGLKLPFASVAVALDQDPAEGLTWLQQLVGFDELSAGHRWLNGNAIDYLWRDSTSLGVTPQVVIAVRDVRIAQTRLRVSDEAILMRMIGPKDISQMAGIGDLQSRLIATALAKTT